MKYKNKKTEFNGILFDSKKEMERYKELLEKCENNEICDLKRQIKYILQPKFYVGKVCIREISYIADFTYIENGKQIVEDVKSAFTRKDKLYNVKKKLFMFKYQDIEFREIV